MLDDHRIRNEWWQLRVAKPPPPKKKRVILGIAIVIPHYHFPDQLQVRIVKEDNNRGFLLWEREPPGPDRLNE